MSSGLSLMCVLLTVLSLAVSGAMAVDLAATDLRTEYRADPLGIDVPQPRLSWKLASDMRGQSQRAYQVLVASTADGLSGRAADLWDSGRVEGDQTLSVRYAGKPLASATPYFWKVRVWPALGDQPADSEVNRWTTGLLAESDWRAKWIGGVPVRFANERQPTTAPTTAPATAPADAAMPRMPIFRRAFGVSKPVARAQIFICGLGQFELHCNGRVVGDDVIQPGWTDYKDTCLYVVHDLTSQLRQGENAIGVMLGNGMYHVPVTPRRYTKFTGSFGPPRLIAQLRIDYSDGTSETIASDATWKMTSGPTTFSSVFGGEDHDARLEPTGWTEPGFDDAAWSSAPETSGPGGKLFGASRSAPPIRVAQTFEPVKVTQPKPGVFVYDLGQNASILPQITVDGSAGATVRVTPAELLAKDGTVTQSSMGSPAWLAYTLRGGGAETWSPKFYYVGSRYLQVEGAVPGGEANPSGLPVVSNVAGRFITSSSPIVGEFACSNELFNRTSNLIRWAMRSNMASVLTDCPHREKLGWLEQVHLVGPSLASNFDVALFFAKAAGDMADAQTPDGLVPDIAPEFAVFGGGFRDSPEWGSACILAPWQLYTWYGDEDVLRRQYDVMTRYVAYLGTKAKDHVLTHGLGDWYDLGPKPPGQAQLTPRALTATAFYYRDAVILERIARLLGKTDDATRYATLAADIGKSFNASFYDPAKKTYATGSQTSNAIPLAFRLAPDADRGAILENLVAEIRGRNNALTAGDIGYRYLLQALGEGGRSDVIFDMNSRSDRPGYGYILNTGATSLTEGWDGSSSQNHFMLGHLMLWFYADLAGIRLDESAPAFERIIIRPTPVGDVTWARASHDSARGKIVSSWEIEGGRFTLDVTIPPGATASVHVPTRDAKGVTEGGNPVMLASSDGRHAVIEIGSGTYRFEAAALEGVTP